MEPFPNNDVTTEILSRLPAKSLVAFKCTSKRWYNFVSDPSFLSIYDKRVKETQGIIVQDMLFESEDNSNFVNLLTLTETESTWKNNVMDFLAEKVVLISSSNGILCCRSLVFHDWSYTIYICNTVTREWLQVRPKRYTFGNEDCTGLAVYPFCSSSGAVLMFKLVIPIHSKSNLDTYSFDIYSSDTKKWKTSKEACTFKSPICSISKNIFTNGWLHWLTKDHQIIAFHVEKELSKVIDLPDLLYQLRVYSILGESEKYLHYVCYNNHKIEVWVLKNYEEPAWELKHTLNIYEFCQQHPSFPLLTYNVWIPAAFYDDVVYIRVQSEDVWVISYNFRTKRMHNCAVQNENLCVSNAVPHCVSLVPLNEPPYPFGDCRRKRNRKR